MAQTTVDPEFFSSVRKILTTRLSGLKIVDTTCRFIRNRQRDIEGFSSENHVVLLVGGKQSANCKLLHETAQAMNEKTYFVEKPGDVEKIWFKGAECVGITGGASTPRWQLEEMKAFLDNSPWKKSPSGDKNRKGGKVLWWKRKNSNRTE
jgi:4-hydroxy-3-methylbut-2-enyl diphosphate reductase